MGGSGVQKGVIRIFPDNKGKVLHYFEGLHDFIVACEDVGESALRSGAYSHTPLQLQHELHCLPYTQLHSNRQNAPAVFASCFLTY
jgi:hypothetical protein